MDLNTLLGQLELVSAVSRGQYRARCPAHEDISPSLAVKVLPDRVLLHCHAGCPFHDVIAALGIEASDLYFDTDVSVAACPTDHPAQYPTRRAREVWESATPASPDHPYLVRKSIQPHDLRELTTDCLVVPMRNIQGELHQLQLINGDKVFLRGTRKGLFYSIGVPGCGRLFLAEGVSDCLSIHEVTGAWCAAAMGAGSMRTVAELLHAAYPSTRITVAADNDEPGKRAAQAAADVCGGTVISPAPFKDFNELISRGATYDFDF